MEGETIALRCDESLMYDSATVMKAAYFTALGTVAFTAFWKHKWEKNEKFTVIWKTTSSHMEEKLFNEEWNFVSETW